MGRADWRVRLPFYYGWVVVAGIFVCMALAYILWYGFSVFFVALLEEFRWGRGPTAGVFSLFVITWSLMGVVAGALADRLGPGRVAAVGITIAALGLVGTSRITELWQFYLLYGVVVAAGFSMSAWVPGVTTISRWFFMRLGTALGIASAGIGVGIMVMVPLTQWLISQVGWRSAFVAIAAILFCGVVPVALLVLRGKPEDLGLQRDGIADSTGQPIGPATRRPAIVDREWANRDWTVRSAMRTGRFWAMFAAMMLNSFGIQTIFVHEVAFLVDGGFDKMLVASIVGLVGLISIGAKIGWGWVSDRIGRELTWSFGVAGLLLGTGLLLLTREVAFPPLVYLFAFAFAMGYSVSGPLGPAIGADLFGGRRFGSIYGTLGFSNGIGSSFGAWLAGYLFDVTGSYLTAFAWAALASVLSGAVIWLAAPRKVRRVPGLC